MSNQYATPGRSGPRSGREDSDHQAALLIDFDNVTMGIRSNLAQEFRKLLNSDIIRGNVAVQRAYADWRRYPQYIVPLSEASIDLIFAPAYGSSKKNATDIRLAIDALELVFTRSEIRTFILMSGDSDFSSLVLKLKEYGKYVIGVGIQESSSDLLVQNCDEYYSFSALTGLTKAGEETGERHDPWELVEKAILKMVERNDTMRSDRLKQVMLEIDTSFNEKEQGYSKFNRFVVEAASRGILSIQKMEAGQYAVAPGDRLSSRAADREPSGSSQGGNGKDRGRGRRSGGRRGRGRGQREDRGARAEREDAEPQEKKAARGDREGARREEQPAEARSDEGTDESERERTSRARPKWTMESAVALLNRALDRLLDGEEDSVRDSDVKRRMLELEPEFDEGELGFNKFSKFLQAADGAGHIELTKGPSGNYHVSRPTAGARSPDEGGEAEGEVRADAEQEPGREPVVEAAGAEPEAAATDRQAETEGDDESRESRVKQLARRLFGSYREEEREASRIAEESEDEAETEDAQPGGAPAADARAERPTRESGGGVRAARDPGERDRGRGSRSDRERKGSDRERGGSRSGRAREQRRDRSEQPGQREGRASTKDESGRRRESPDVKDAPAESAPDRSAPADARGTAAPESGRGSGASGESEGGDRKPDEGRKAPAGPGLPDAPRGTIRGRWGTLGRYRPPEAPPPILEGQTAPKARKPEPAESEESGESGESAGSARSAGSGAATGPQPGADSMVPTGPGGATMPTDPQQIVEYVSRRYSGVGERTAETLVDAFGPDVFRILDEQPDRVREVLPEHRAERVIAARREERESAAQ